MTFFSKYISFLLLVLVGQTISAQDERLAFQNITVEDGLSQSAVLCILQDPTGYLWFGTADGLNRYDGYEFIHFRHQSSDPQSISDNFIVDLEQSNSGKIWIGTNGGGICYFDPVRFTSTNYYNKKGVLNSLSSNEIKSLLEDSKGQLWVGAYNGLNRFNAATNDFTYFPYRPDSTSLDYTVYDIQELPDGNLLIGTDYGPLFVDTKTKKLAVPNNEMRGMCGNKPGNSIYTYTILQASNGNYWLGTELGIAVFSPDFKAIHQFVPGGELDFDILEVTKIAEDKEGNIWIGSNGEGLAIYNAEKNDFSYYLTNPFDRYSISDNFIVDIYQDRSGVIWLGTYGGSITKFDRFQNQFKLVTHQIGNENGLSSQRVFAINEDKNRNLWVGTEDGGITKIIPANPSVLNSVDEYAFYLHDSLDENSISSNGVWAITDDKTGNLWIGTVGGGLNYLNVATGQFRHFLNDSLNDKSIGDNNIYSLLYEDSILWVGTDRGLSKMDIANETFTNYILDEGNIRLFSTNTVLALMRDHLGLLWVGTFGGGLSQFDEKHGFIKRYMHDRDNPQSLSYDKIMCIVEDHENRFWIGTFGGGLNLFDRETDCFKSIMEKDGLPNDVVYSVIEDDNHLLWMSSNKGISMYHPNTEKFINYNFSYNLQSDEFNQGAYCKGVDGTLYFGGIRGLNYFHPEKLKTNTYVPPIDVVAFSLPGERIIIDKDEEGLPVINLTYKENNIFFEFVAFNFVNSRNNRYRYKLEGINKDWVDVGRQRDASFTNLAPGTYLFSVQASNNDGVWNEKGFEIKVVVQAPFFLKWWFVPVLFILSILILGLITWLTIYNIKTKAKQQLIESELRATSAQKESIQHKLASLRAQMDPHFIFNSLNSIQHFIAQNDKKSARQYLTRFSSLIRMILNNSRSDKVILEDELETITHYIELEKLRFDNRFNYEIEVDSEVDQGEIEIPTMLLQPYVENAIIHGLKNRMDDQGFLKLQIHQEGEYLTVIIEDNGVGREAARSIKEQKETKYKSLGMSVTQNRLELIDDETEKPAVSITDLFHENGDAAGTRVTIRIKTEH